MSQSQGVYVRRLLLKGLGYPLWNPEPDAQGAPLPEYQNLGVRIGDVGKVTLRGSWDFMFNICLPPDHPVNAGRTPENFETLVLDDLVDGEIQPNRYPAGSHIACSSMTKSTLDEGGSPLVRSRCGSTGLEFASSIKEDAVLVLPDGADSKDVTDKARFRAYALQHGLAWHRHADVKHGREAAHGSLYLVTGCDKAISWGIAAFSSLSEGVRLKFMRNGDRASAGYSWHSGCPGDFRVHPDGSSPQPALPTTKNQCVFIRGFRISIRETFLDRDGLQNVERGRHTPFVGVPPSLSDDHPDGSNYMHALDPYHPLDNINNWMLHEAQVAVTHDDDWVKILDCQDTEFPDDVEILHRVSHRYIPVLQGGNAFLRPSEENNAFAPTEGRSPQNRSNLRHGHSNQSGVLNRWQEVWDLGVRSQIGALVEAMAPSNRLIPYQIGKDLEKTIEGTLQENHDTSDTPDEDRPSFVTEADRSIALQMFLLENNVSSPEEILFPLRHWCDVEDLDPEIARLRQYVELSPSLSTFYVKPKGLPLGWDINLDENGEVNFVDLKTSMTTRIDPRPDRSLPRGWDILTQTFPQVSTTFGDYVALLRLAYACRARYHRLGHKSDLSDSTHYHSIATRIFQSPDFTADARIEALAFVELLRHYDNVGRIRMVIRLAESHTRYFYAEKNVEDIDSAIKHYKLAVKISSECLPHNISDLAEILEALSYAHVERWRCVSSTQDTPTPRSMVTCFQESIALTENPHDRLRRTRDLAVLAAAQFTSSGLLEDLCVVVQALDDSFTLAPDDTGKLADLLDLLGPQIRQTVRKLAQDNKVDKTIPCFLRLAQIAAAAKNGTVETDCHVCIINCCLDTSNASVSDLDVVIHHQQKALALFPNDSEYLPRIVLVQQLAESHFERFRLSDDVADSEHALAHYEDAMNSCIELATDDAWKVAGMLGNLSRVNRLRFVRLYNGRDIDNWVFQCQAAVWLTSADHADYSTRLLDTGDALYARFMFAKYKPEQCQNLTLNDADLDVAIRYHREALNVMALRSSITGRALLALGESLIMRFEHHWETPDRDEAIPILQQCVSLLSSSPRERFHAASFWAASFNIKFRTKEDLECSFEGHVHAVSLMQQLTWIGIDATKRLELHRGLMASKELVTESAACAIKLSEFDMDNQQYYLERAIELLDQGRSLIWSQAAQCRIGLDDMKGVPENLALDLQRVAQTLDRLAFREDLTMLSLDNTIEGDISTDNAEEQRRLAEEWHLLLIQVREVPGKETFLLPAPFSQLRQAATDATTIVINVCLERCDAIIIPPHGQLQLVQLAHLSLEKASAMTNLLLTEILPTAARGGFRVTPSSFDPERQLLECLYILWETVAEPILLSMKVIPAASVPIPLHSRCRIRWCLTSSLVFLPLHAAQPRPAAGDGLTDVAPGMIDLVVSSYIPTMSAICNSQLVSSHSPSDFNMLAVSMPSHGLASAQQEMEVLLALPVSHKISFLCDSGATTSSVLQGLQQSTWVHFACHAKQDRSAPMNSAFVLENGTLPLWTISKNALPKSELALLLACETAKGSTKDLDQAIHLAAGLQFVGFRSIIATFWSMMDEDGPIITKQVYDYLFRDWPHKQPNPLEAAYALHQAVNHLRNTLKRSPLSWVPFMHYGL